MTGRRSERETTCELATSSEESIRSSRETVNGQPDVLPLKATSVGERGPEARASGRAPVRARGGSRLICPSCFKHNRAWVLYARCPFCGARGRPIPEVVGPGWGGAFAAMLDTTGGESHISRCGSPLCWGRPHPVRARDPFPDVVGDVWYPAEEICSAARVNEPGVGRRMRRITRVAKVSARPEPDEPGYPGLVDTYFTLADLRSLKRVDRRIRGRNPDLPLGLEVPEPVQERRGSNPADATAGAVS